MLKHTPQKLAWLDTPSNERKVAASSPPPRRDFQKLKTNIHCSEGKLLGEYVCTNEHGTRDNSLQQHKPLSVRRGKESDVCRMLEQLN